MTQRLYFLDQVRGAVMTSRPDGSDLAALVEGCENPDGIVVDAGAGYLYWTNMGANFDQPDGSVERIRLDGSERTTIIPKGATRTPKQLRLDTARGHVYWCDREGMRVMRANLDGSSMETLVATGHAEIDSGDATRWCVGLALDLDRRQIYWTQKGPPGGCRGRIFRAPMDRLRGQTMRDGIELLTDRLPEPVDLELGDSGNVLYWTDRSRGQGGGSFYRARIDAATRVLSDAELIVSGMDRPIGLALDRHSGRMFVTDLGGNLYAGDADGGRWEHVLSQAGKLTGICLL